MIEELRQLTKLDLTINQLKVIKDKYLKESPTVESWLRGVCHNIALADILHSTNISEEEIWACTLCNACAQECPININQPSLILEMRRYLVMEESAAPAELNSVFSNIENNGAPWQFSRDDRMQWAEDLYMNELS